MALVEINPSYYARLQQQGLLTAERLLGLPGLIISGHPERHVAQVRIQDPIGEIRAFLKREHVVRWRDRLASAWAGFGLVSRSVREGRMLQAAQRAGVGCPDWIATGEDDQGRAFLLLAELTGAIDLRQWLHRTHSEDTEQRPHLARRLGEALARLHNAGFDHPDLYAKHILIDPCHGSIHFLDWQRSRRRPRTSWKQREHDLAVLDATLADGVVSPRERLRCLRAYFRQTQTFRHRLSLKWTCERICQYAAQALRRRHVRAERSIPQLQGAEGVYWLDGEAFCVTHGFWQDLQGQSPTWLMRMVCQGRSSTREMALPRGRRGMLVCRQQDQPLVWLWSLLRGRRLVSAEVRQAGMLFRQQRRGEPAPRLLAFGQRRLRLWRMQSFLLTEIDTPEEEKCR